MMKQNTQKQSGRSSCWRGILFLAMMLTAAVFFYGCSLGDGQSDQASLQSDPPPPYSQRPENARPAGSDPGPDHRRIPC